MTWTVLRPEGRYARADDGVTIAYPVAGAGPVTMVVVSPLISQLELAWEEPALEHFRSRFAACARAVLSGRRGAGSPDRSAGGERLHLAAPRPWMPRRCWTPAIPARRYYPG